MYVRHIRISLLLLSLLLGGCTRSWQLEPIASTPPARAGREHNTQLRHQLELELAKLERQLGELDVGDRRWQELGDQRLAVVIALTKLDRGEVAVDGQTLISDASQLLEQLRVERPYRRAHRGGDSVLETEVTDGKRLKEDPQVTGSEEDLELKAEAKKKPKLVVRGDAEGDTTTEDERRGQPVPAAAQVEHVEVPDGVMTAVSARLSELSECVPEDLRLDPSLRIEVSARLSSGGAFRDARVSAGALLDPEIEQCLVDVLLRVRVEDYVGDSRTVSFPLMLQD